MKSSIFKNAEFGDKYVTENGQLVLIVGNLVEQELVYLLTEGGVYYWTNYAGFPLNKDFTVDTEDVLKLKVVSKYQKSVDESTLDEMAFTYYCDDCRYCKEANAVTMQDRREVCMSTRCPGRTYRWQLMHGFKAGYLEAMEDATEQKAIDIERFLSLVDSLDVDKLYKEAQVLSDGSRIPSPEFISRLRKAMEE